MANSQETEIAVLKEQMATIRRDLDSLEASIRWLWRTVLTAVVGALVALAFTGVQNALTGG